MIFFNSPTLCICRKLFFEVINGCKEIFGKYCVQKLLRIKIRTHFAVMVTAPGRDAELHSTTLNRTSEITNRQSALALEDTLMRETDSCLKARPKNSHR